MNRENRSFRQLLLGLLVMAALVSLVWANHQLVQRLPAGKEFIVQWVSARSFATQGLSPYSQAVTDRIQAEARSQSIQVDQPALRMVTPLYSLVVTLPLGLIPDLSLARTLWLILEEVVLAGIYFIAARITGWKPRLPILFSGLLFVLINYYSFQALVSGSLAIWSAFFIVLTLAALRANQDVYAGILLTFTTIFPHPVFLFVVLILIWIIQQRRLLVITWFFGTLSILTIIGTFLLPGWPLEYLRILVQYAGITVTTSPGEIFRTWWPGVGAQLGWALTAILVLLLLGEWWSARNQEYRWLLWCSGLTLVINQLVGIPTDTSSFVVLILPLIIILNVWGERWRRSTWLILGSLLLLFVATWGMFGSNLEFESQKLGLFFPLPFFLLLGLYWVRWWAIRPPRLLVEELRLRE